MKHHTAFALAATGLVASIALFNPTPAQAAHEDGRRGVTLYEHEDFGGRAETFYADNSRLDGTRIGNDRASSVRVDPGCEAILYDDANFGGRSSIVTGDMPVLRSTALGGDAASSIRVSCRPLGGGHPPFNWGGRPGAVLYEDVGFEGGYEVFYDDDRNLEGSRIGNDDASSVRVAPGCKVTLYENARFRGERTTVTGDLDDLRGTQLGNDRASSLRLECWRRWR